MIVKHQHNGFEYEFSNSGELSVGDLVFPISMGLTTGGQYYHHEFDFRDFMCGFPDDPHMVRDPHHSSNKTHEVHTSHGFGPREKYFRIIQQTKIK